MREVILLIVLPHLIVSVCQGIPDNLKSCELGSGELGFCQLREDCKNYSPNAQYEGKRSDKDVYDKRVCSGAHEICCPREEGSNITSASDTSDAIIKEPAKTLSKTTSDPRKMNGTSSRSARATESNPDSIDPNTLLPLTCGLNSIEYVGFVVGGFKTDPRAYPWMAALEYGTPKGSMIGCGGSLITAQHVLTAAHCLTPGYPPTWILRSVRLGDWNISSEIDCEDPYSKTSCRPRHIDVPVVMQIKHESYNLDPKARLTNDIGLLKLGHTVKFTKEIQPICLPIKPDLPKYMTVIGWGRTELGIQSQVLLEADIPLADKQKCESIYQVYGFGNLGPTQICAGGKPDVDSCSGDSGGPLMADIQEKLDVGERSRTAVVGIVSFGSKSCGVRGFPGIYTKVYDYIPWILDKIRASSDVSAKSDNARSVTIQDRAKNPNPPAETESLRLIFPN